MPLACKICIMMEGLKGSQIDSLPTTYEELYDHVERVHGILVQRVNETPEEGRKRMQRIHGLHWPKGFEPHIKKNAQLMQLALFEELKKILRMCE